MSLLLEHEIQIYQEKKWGKKVNLSFPGHNVCFIIISYSQANKTVFKNKIDTFPDGKVHFPAVSEMPKKRFTVELLSRMWYTKQLSHLDYRQCFRSISDLTNLWANLTKKRTSTILSMLLTREMEFGDVMSFLRSLNLDVILQSLSIKSGLSAEKIQSCLGQPWSSVIAPCFAGWSVLFHELFWMYFTINLFYIRYSLPQKDNELDLFDAGERNHKLRLIMRNVWIPHAVSAPHWVWRSWSSHPFPVALWTDCWFKEQPLQKWYKRKNKAPIG